jgi:hypothetical protein
VLKRVPEDVRSGPGWTSNASGTVTVTGNNAVLSDLDINGSVQGASRYDGLKITDTRIRCVGEESWCLALGNNSTVTDTDIGGLANGTSFSYAAGIWSGPSDNARNVIQRVNAHHLTRAIELNGNTDVLDNYLHDFPMGDPVYRASCSCMYDGAHSSNMFISKGWHILIRHNSFSYGNSANVFVQDYNNDAAGVGDITFDHNLFTALTHLGQKSAYGIGFENKDVKGPVVVTNNVFSKSGWNAAPAELPKNAATPRTVTSSGNVFTDGTSAEASFLYKPVLY